MMTPKQFLHLIKLAEEKRQRESDQMISFGEVESKLSFDQGAEKLVAAAMLSSTLNNLRKTRHASLQTYLSN